MDRRHGETPQSRIANGGERIKAPSQPAPNVNSIATTLLDSCPTPPAVLPSIGRAAIDLRVFLPSASSLQRTK
jgi:hypothetical protein